MVRVDVPPDFSDKAVRFAGTPPNDDAQRLGAPRNEHIRVSDRNARDAVVREDSDGRYVAVPDYYAEKVREYFADEFGAEFDTDGGDETADTSDVDGPLPDADDTESAHWRTVTGAIGEGHYDDDLATVAENDGRESVQKAVVERRDELEG